MTLPGRAMLLFSALLLASCGQGSPSPSATSEAASANDAAQPNQIVVMSPALAVMLQELGHEDAIVGKHTWDMVLSDAVPELGDQFELDYEALLTLNPTHVYTQYESAGVPDRLRELATQRGWHLEDYRLNTLEDIAQALDDLYLDLGGTVQRDQPLQIEGVELGSMPVFDQPLPSDKLGTALADRGPSVRGSGRVLLLGAADSPAALGPGSFHHEILSRIGGTAAIETGSPWMTLDAEDVLRLAPDAIVLFSPRTITDDERWPEGEPTWDDLTGRLGALATLPIPAIQQQRVLLIDHPLSLLPSPALAEVADELAAALERWSK